MAERLVLAVDLGGTQVRVALVDGEGLILARASEPTLAREGADAVIGQIVRLSGVIVHHAGGRPIVAAGLSSPGPLDTDTGMALGLPSVAGFYDFPIRESVARALGLPVILENDGIAAAIGEWRYGAGRGLANLVYVTVSTGIGGGVIIGNHVLRGRRGMAGHVGHMSFVVGGERCGCGNLGCFEAYASGTALARRAGIAAAADGKTSLGRGGWTITARDVFAAAADGDELAARLVREEAHMLGAGFASLLHLYSPDVLIMGGGVSQGFEVLEPGIVASMRASAIPAFRDVPLLKAGLGPDSGLLGAAWLALNETTG